MLNPTFCAPCTPQEATATTAIMQIADLDRVIAIEETAYSHPWSRGNFVDAMNAGNQVLILQRADQVLGYSVAMMGFEEAHVLNITVAPAHQRQGWAVVLLRAMHHWAQAQGAQSLWLEVRRSNERAQAVYTHYGFTSAGLRKKYYAITPHEREDAVVMHLNIPTSSTSTAP